MIGCDIVKVDRIERLASNPRFLEKCFTEEERSYFNRFSQNAPTIAGHFAAKEALAKALGCGFGAQLDFLDFSITHDGKGCPHILWHHQNQTTPLEPSEIYWEGRVMRCSISISHEKEFAMATALIH